MGSAEASAAKEAAVKFTPEERVLLDLPGAHNETAAWAEDLVQTFFGISGPIHEYHMTRESLLALVLQARALGYIAGLHQERIS